MTYTVVYFKPFGPEEILIRTDVLDHAKIIFHNYVEDYPRVAQYVHIFFEDDDITEEIKRTLVPRRHLI